MRDLRPIMQLWTNPQPDDDALAIRRFAEFYCDPVLVNGAPLGLAAMVARARAQFRAFSGLRVEILHQLDGASETAVSFKQVGQHTGPMLTPLGEIAPTGQPVERQVIDILIFDADNRVREIHVVGDELGALVRLGALALRS